MKNQFYNAWKEKHDVTLFVVDPDTVRMQDAVRTFERCVCREDVRREWNRVNRWWYALTGDDMSIPPAAFVADRFERAYSAMVARMTSTHTRYLNQEYGEPEPTRNDIQGI